MRLRYDKRFARDYLLDTLFHLLTPQSKRMVNDYDFMPPVYAKCKGQWKCARYNHPEENFTYNEVDELPAWIKADIKDETEQQLLVKMMVHPHDIRNVQFMRQKRVLYCLAVQIPKNRTIVGISRSSSTMQFYFGYTTHNMEQRCFRHQRSHCKVTKLLATERNNFSSSSAYCAHFKQSLTTPLLCDSYLMLSHLEAYDNKALVVVRNFNSKNALMYAESEFINSLRLHEKMYAMNVQRGDFEGPIEDAEREEANRWLKKVDEWKQGIKNNSSL